MSSTAPKVAVVAEEQIQLELPPFGRISGRIEVLKEANNFVPPGYDPATGVTSRDVDINRASDISARLFLPKETTGKLPILVFFHGGGFYQCSAFDKNYTDCLNTIASRTMVLCVSVEYSLAPANLLPAAYDDALTALKWLLSSPKAAADPWLAKYGDFEHIFISGDSAGGNITHQLALQLGENGIQSVEGAVLLCPYFWGKDPIEGEITAPCLRLVAAFRWNMVGVELDHPWMNPVVEGAPSLAGLGCKRAFVCLAENDVYFSRGRAYYKGLKASGWEGEAESEEYAGVGHVWFIFDRDHEQTQKLMTKLAAFFYQNIK